MIIGFKDRFVEKIEDGTKIHTIREDKHNRWKEGRRMDMATGVRTKTYRKFKEQICNGTQKISIRYDIDSQDVKITIDNHLFGIARIGNGRIYYYWSCLDELAKNDGFESVHAFFRWFDKDFEGKIIHWTERRY